MKTPSGRSEGVRSVAVAPDMGARRQTEQLLVEGRCWVAVRVAIGNMAGLWVR